MPGAEARYKITADDQTRRGLSSARRRVQLFGAALAGVAVGAITDFRALFQLLERGLTSAQRRLDSFAKAGLEIGTSAEDVRELGFAADKLDVPFAKAVKLVGRLDKAIGDTSQESTDAFAALGIDRETLGNVEDVTDRIVLFASALERLEKSRGRAVREDIEQTLVGTNLSKLLAEGGRLFAAEVERSNYLGLIDGTNEAAAAAERAGDAWLEAGKTWAKLFENLGFFTAAEKTANLLTAAALSVKTRKEQRLEIRAGLSRSERIGSDLSPLFKAFTIVRDRFRGGQFDPSQRTQAGGFIPQQVPERLSQAATKQSQSADSLVRATRALERTLNRYGP